MVSVPVTAPLRQPEDIHRCLERFSAGDADVVITVTEADRSPYFNMVRENSDGSVDLVISPKLAIARRQDVPVVYDITTVAYVVNPEFVFSSDAIFKGRVHAVHIPKERAIDIDTLLDFRIAEYLLELQKN